MKGCTALKIAASLNFIAALTHVAIVLGGPDWYRFFGAGEGMAQLAESGSNQPGITTLFIAFILFVWGLYALSGAGVILRLPLLKIALVIITSIYSLRALAGFILPFVSSHPALKQNTLTFWLVSSGICLIFATVHFIGMCKSWNTLNSKD